MQNVFFISDHALTQKIADKIIHKYLPEDKSTMVIPPSSVATLSSASTLFWLNQQGQFVIGSNQILAAYLRLIPTILKFCPDFEDATPAQLLENLRASPERTSQFPMTLQTQLQFIMHQFQANTALNASLPSISCKQMLSNITPPSTPPAVSTPPLTPVSASPTLHHQPAFPISMDVTFPPTNAGTPISTPTTSSPYPPSPVMSPSSPPALSPPASPTFSQPHFSSEPTSANSSPLFSHSMSSLGSQWLYDTSQWNTPQQQHSFFS